MGIKVSVDMMNTYPSCAEPPHQFGEEKDLERPNNRCSRAIIEMVRNAWSMEMTTGKVRGARIIARVQVCYFVVAREKNQMMGNEVFKALDLGLHHVPVY